MSYWSNKRKVASWAAVSLVGLLLIPAMVYGGTSGKISGVVTDSETGQPIAGALVEVIGTDYTAYTDAFGHAQVICGGVDAMVDFDLNLWDAAASEILVSEAGGRCNVIEQANGKLGLVMGSPALIDPLLALLEG